MSAKTKTKSEPRKNFMVYFKTQEEYDQMTEAARIHQVNPKPNLSEFARYAIRKVSKQIIEAEQ